jgi:hypothetical protein
MCVYASVGVSTGAAASERANHPLKAPATFPALWIIHKAASRAKLHSKYVRSRVHDEALKIHFRLHSHFHVDVLLITF